MFRLLIVDDEPQIVDWLFELLQEEQSLDLDVYKAYSGFSALELLQSTRIDIVLSDIYMPGMDGIQLLNQIHRNWPLCKVIFLTGYRNFEYAFEAIRNDCVSYLLKTEDDEEIVDAVRKAANQINKSLKDEELLKKATQQFNMALPFLQKNFLLEIIDENNLTELEQEKLNELKIPLFIEKPVMLMLGFIDRQLPEVKRTQIQEFQFALKMIMEQYFNVYSHKICIEYGRHGILCVVQSEFPAGCGEIDDVVYMKGMLETVQAACKKSLGITVSFILHEKAIPWNRTAQELARLKQLLDFESVIGNEILMTDKSFENRVSSSNPFYGDSVVQALIDLKRIHLLTSYLEHGQREEFFNLLSDLTAHLKDIKSMHFLPAIEIFYTVSTRLLSYINQWRLFEVIAFKIDINRLYTLDQFSAWDEAVAYLNKLAEITFDVQRNHLEVTSHNSILQIKQYINNHLGGDLSLVKLADVSCFNPSYLSRLFKQVTGENLFKYIMEARLEKARELLEKTDMKIQEIAAAVGCESSTYFGRVFKKSKNMTPQEYRESRNINK